MNTDKFKSSFLGFLDEPTENVLLVKGQWGVGKTFHIEQCLEENKEKYKYIKVSLFGLDNIEDLSRAVSESLINNYISPSISKFGKTVASVPFISKFIPKELPSLDEISMENSFTKFVIFFDDIERMTLDLQMFFGYVDRLKNTSPFKMVIALNDKQLKDKKIWELKEKITDREVRIKDTLDNIIDKIFQEDKELATTVFSQLKVVNLRVIIKASHVMNVFVDKAEGLTNENLQRLKVSCLCLSSKYYSSEDFDDNRLDEYRRYDKHFLLNGLINSYLDSQIFNDDFFQQKISSIINFQITNDNNEKFEEIMKLFESTFEDNSDKIISLSHEFILGSSLNESQLTFIVSMLVKLGENIPKSAVESWIGEDKKSDFFINDLINILNDGEVRDIVINYHNSLEKDEPVEANDIALDETCSLISGCLFQALHSRFAFVEDDLSVYSKDDWMQYIKSNNPIEVFRRIQDEIVEFLSDEKGSALKEALSDLSESPIQKMRLINVFGNKIESILSQ
ncbi:P-loop NTPase fold protein [Vibrio panuliri]|uniref:P-loop NTPase fold protein n=1 Tax=Vibrio panuliri TaxID=1381081 RepID=UPI0012473160|nr:P-loop NTPase fold protein [Vibrio panuliri]KAB1457191.1 hypothetical protein F7O85_05420 [Vibrio panuliri]